MEIKFLRVTLNTTKKDKVINIVIRLELGVDEITNGIQESRLRWFEQVMRMRKYENN